MKAGKDEARPTIEETPLPKIDIQKSQSRSERKLSEKASQ